MERLFTNPEWNKLADETRVHEPGVVEDQINRVIGRIKHRSDRLQNSTLSLSLSLSELDQARLEFDSYVTDLSVLLQQPGVLETYENFLQYEAYASRGNPLENFYSFRKQFNI